MMLATGRVTAKLCLLAGLASVVPGALLVLLAYFWAEPLLIQELNRKALAVGSTVKGTFERAVDVGIPVDKLSGVPPYFARLLQDNPDIRFIAVTDPARKLVFYEGISRHRLGPILEEIDVGFATERIGRDGLQARNRTTIDDFSVEVLPIGASTSPDAVLYVAVQRSVVARRLREGWPLFAGLLAVAMAAGIGAVLVAQRRVVGARLGRLEGSMAAVDDGRFALASSVSGRDEIGTLARTYDATLWVLRARLQALVTHAEEARDAALSRDVRDRLEAIRRQALDGIGQMLEAVPLGPPVAIQRHGRLTRWARNMPLRLRVTLIVTIGAALMAAGLAYGGVARESLSEEAFAEDKRSSLIVAWKTFVDDEIAKIGRSIAPVASDPDLLEALHDDDRLRAWAVIRQWRDRLIDAEAISRLDVTDDEGTSLTIDGTQFDERPLIAPRTGAPIVERRLTIGGVTRDPARNPVVLRASPLVLGDSVVGIVAAAVDLASVVVDVASVMRGDAYLIATDGSMIYGTDPPLWRRLAPAINVDGAGIQRTRQEGGAYAVVMTGIPSVEGGRFGTLAVVIDTSELVKRQDLLRAAFVTAGILFGLLALLGLYAYLRGSFEPLDTVIGGLESLAQGRTGVWIDTPDGNDEIGRIARAVAAFRGSLEEVDRLSAERRRRQRRQERFIRRQLESLTEAVGEEARRAVSDELGKLQPQADGSGTAPDEFEALALVFEQMAIRIREQHGRLTELVDELREALRHKEELAYLQRELSIAHDMQLSILPREFPPQETIEIAGLMKPAKEVGGDFYDFFSIDERQVGVAVADVSGKGIPAAFFMLISRTLLKSTAIFGMPPEKVLERLNDLLADENEQMMFVTAFYAVIDTETGRLTYANAGHNQTYRLQTDGTVTSLPAEPGMALAVFGGRQFTVRTIDLDPGDAVFFYTDGVNEAFDAAGDQYGDARLTTELSRCAGMNSRETADAILASVERFSEGVEQSDDITCVVLRYLGNGDATAAGTVDQRAAASPVH